MRRLMILLSLLAALAGTPLRIAEAASDLARSLAETAGQVEIEVIDGGVGDDSDATIKADCTQDRLSESIVEIESTVDWLALILPAQAFPPTIGISNLSRTLVSERRAWLPRFRF